MLPTRFSSVPWPWRRTRHPVVAVVRLSGIIGAMGIARRGMTLAGLAGPLERAFASPRTQAVALAINSPGGSPVQASLIARRIRDLAEEKSKPVYAFVEDVGASGGYWLACAADEIYADRASIVGSIGVISAGFGLHDLIARYGVERRVYTAGSRKLILDPFQPERPEDVEKIRAIQRDVHGTFKAVVRERRGVRLKAGEEALFEGEMWTGDQALALGLIDGIGHLRPVLREKYGDAVRLRLIGGRRRWLRPRFSLETAAGALADGLVAALEERSLWRRFGL